MKKEIPPMRLSNLQLQNFKCFKKEQNIDFKKLTILTGANSSGKSSIIYSILGAMQTPDFPFQYSPNGKYVDMGDFKDISYAHRSSNDIQISFAFSDNKGEPYYSIKTVWKENKKNKLPELFYLFYKDESTSISIKKMAKGYSLDFDYAPKNKKADHEVSKLMIDLSYIVDSLGEKMGTIKKISRKDRRNNIKKRIESRFTPEKLTNIKFDDIEEFIDKIKDTGSFGLFTTLVTFKEASKAYDSISNFVSSTRLNPLRTYLEKSKVYKKVGKSGEEYLDQIIAWEDKNDPKWKELISIMKNLSLLYSIRTKRMGGGRYEIVMSTRERGAKSSISDIGFGISQFLPIIVADLQLDKNSTLFISQPELHLHPNAQAAFADYICDQIERNSKNYIIETHSECFLNRLRLAIVKNKIKEENISIQYLENTKDDVEIHKIIFNKKGEIQGAPESFFSTYLIDLREIALNAE